MVSGSAAAAARVVFGGRGDLARRACFERGGAPTLGSIVELRQAQMCRIGSFRVDLPSTELAAPLLMSHVAVLPFGTPSLVAPVDGDL